jgi:hypothetical protein
MKKLKLDLQHLNAEVLTRSQLKKVLGGDGGSDDGGDSGGCDPVACAAKSNSNTGSCSCNSHGRCLCVKVWG